MDFFASDAFLTALARDYYHARTIDFKLYDVEGSKVRLAEINGKKVVTTGPFYDYVKSFPSEEPSEGRIGYIPKLVTSLIALDDREPAASMPATALDPAPVVIWDRFATWEEYAALLRKRSKNMFPTRGNRARKLLHEHGEPAFTFDNPDIEALDLCIQWKARQYKGGHETLEDPDALAMLNSLFHGGHLILSSLKMGDRYVAVQAGFLWQGEYLGLIPAYDPAFTSYGVGKELLFRILEYSYAQGHKRYDFLQGAERYKWDFATHAQVIDSYGTPPLALRARDAVERSLKAQLLALSPRLFYDVKRLVLFARRNLANARNKLRGYRKTRKQNWPPR